MLCLWKDIIFWVKKKKNKKVNCGYYKKLGKYGGKIKIKEQKKSVISLPRDNFGTSPSGILSTSGCEGERVVKLWLHFKVLYSAFLH